MDMRKQEQRNPNSVRQRDYAREMSLCMRLGGPFSEKRESCQLEEADGFAFPAFARDYSTYISLLILRFRAISPYISPTVLMMLIRWAYAPPHQTRLSIPLQGLITSATDLADG
jgi:hypothetical protein